MPCAYPLPAYRSREITKTSYDLGRPRFKVVVKNREGHLDLPLRVNCGLCTWCRLNRARQWAIRCTHEAQMWPQNTFITLTYRPEDVPAMSLIHNREVRATLVKEHFQSFMKRLRAYYSYSSEKDPRPIYDHIRYYMCGEYGEKNGRPHYHALLFNMRFHDQRPWKTVRGCKYYLSDTLRDLWRLGDVAIGEVNYKTAAYIARYVLKKQFGKDSYLHYDTLSPDGEILHERLREYTDMSRGYGIGKTWIETYKSDVYPHDVVVVGEKTLRPPRYYDNQFEKSHPFVMDDIKKRRVQIAKDLKKDEDPMRALQKDECLILSLKQLVRSLENGT